MSRRIFEAEVISGLLQKFDMYHLYLYTGLNQKSNVSWPIFQKFEHVRSTRKKFPLFLI